MSVNDDFELKGMERVSEVARIARDSLAAAAKPGITTRALDRLCGRIYRSFGAVSAPRHFYGAPVNAFVSVNEAVVHGLPADKELRPGDIVKIDVTPMLGGFVADTALTVVVGADAMTENLGTRLASCARGAFYRSLEVVRAGRSVTEIGRSVFRTVNDHGYFVIKELSGHGLGRTIHEEPSIPNYDDGSAGPRLGVGMVIAIEPMISARDSRVYEKKDGWTIATRNGSPTAHYEHTLIVTEGYPIVLTA